MSLGRDGPARVPLGSRASCLVVFAQRRNSQDSDHLQFSLQYVNTSGSRDRGKHQAIDRLHACGKGRGGGSSSRLARGTLMGHGWADCEADGKEATEQILQHNGEKRDNQASGEPCGSGRGRSWRGRLLGVGLRSRCGGHVRGRCRRRQRNERLLGGVNPDPDSRVLQNKRHMRWLKSCRRFSIEEPSSRPGWAYLFEPCGGDHWPRRVPGEGDDDVLVALGSMDHLPGLDVPDDELVILGAGDDEPAVVSDRGGDAVPATQPRATQGEWRARREGEGGGAFKQASLLNVSMPSVRLNNLLVLPVPQADGRVEGRAEDEARVGRE